MCRSEDKWSDQKRGKARSARASRNVDARDRAEREATARRVGKLPSGGQTEKRAESEEKRNVQGKDFPKRPRHRPSSELKCRESSPRRRRRKKEESETALREDAGKKIREEGARPRKRRRSSGERGWGTEEWDQGNEKWPIDVKSHGEALLNVLAVFMRPTSRSAP